MARFRKGEFIAKIRIMGYPTKEIAEMIYKDGSEIGQSKVRAMYSYLKKKGLLQRTMSKANDLRCIEYDNYLAYLLLKFQFNFRHPFIIECFARYECLTILTC